jgi:hypothetical protein
MRKIVDNTQYDSPANKMRRNRLRFFMQLVDQLTQTAALPLKILDVGGTENFWRGMGGVPENCEITLLNLTAPTVTLEHLTSEAGNAVRMPQYADKQFDIVFSNSTIEHVGDYAAQQSFANEVQRTGNHYVIQTPNKWFPIEPHFYTFPFWQFYPVSLRIAILTRMKVGWNAKTDAVSARAKIEEIRLLGEKEFIGLFPGCNLYREKVVGLVKSYLVWK